MQLDLKPTGGKSYNTADLSSRKWNGPVCCSQYSYFGTFPFEEGGGRVLAVKVFAFTVCLLNLRPVKTAIFRSSGGSVNHDKMNF